ncbi:WapI family immunity protein [Paracidovorax oryzae]|uniref:WapI family immunity protein n=1 Tax=Paracidovorax oryzae TaxID=862720 RepID=UPI0012FE931D|nr:hypothetical protein [Paracidovorax oryzae]
MLDIDFDDLKFSMEPLSRQTEGNGGPYMDWLKLEVKVMDGDFSGRVNWLVMPSEIAEFRKNISQIYESLVCGGKDIESITFSGVEPDFSLSMSIANSVGHIFAQYTLKNSPDGPTLQGSFGLDQSYLPRWIEALDEMLEYRG